MRRWWWWLGALAVLAAACGGSDGGPVASVGSGDLGTPPIAAGSNPRLVGAGERLFLLGSRRARLDGAAVFDLAAQRWTELPDPPALAQSQAVWSGADLVLVGLDDCDGPRCTGAALTAAWLADGDSTWEVARIGDRPVDAEDLALDVVGGRGGVAHVANATRVLTLERSHLRSTSEPLPLGLAWRYCETDAGPVALGVAEGSDPAALLQATWRSSVLYRLVDARWQPVAAPSVADPTKPIGATCSTAGLVVTDPSAGSSMTWTGKAWAPSTAPGAPPLPYVAPLTSGSGDPVVPVDGALVRLDRAAGRWVRTDLPSPPDGGPPTRTFAPTSAGVAVLELPHDGPARSRLYLVEV